MWGSASMLRMEKGDGGRGRGEEAERVARARGKAVRQPRQPHDLPHLLPEIQTNGISRPYHRPCDRPVNPRRRSRSLACHACHGRARAADDVMQHENVHAKAVHELVVVGMVQCRVYLMLKGSRLENSKHCCTTKVKHPKGLQFSLFCVVRPCSESRRGPSS